MVIELAGKRIGGGARCFVIAEAGVNHNGDPTLAMQLVEAAARAGVDAVKFQTFDPKALASASAPKAEYQNRSSTGASQLEMLSALTLAPEVYRRLQARAQDLGLVFLSSPFDEASADFLAELGVPAFKVASGELTNTPFLRHIARFGRPMLVSTGMAELEEVRGALAAIRTAAPAAQVALFHCVSSYPARATDANLRAMATMRSAFGVPVGWSDHLESNTVSLAAVALGAEVLEKHLTLDRKMAGPDHAASTEPEDFARLVAELREIESALGTGIKAPVESERGIAAVARKSLHWRRALAAGDKLAASDVACLRPGTGLSPARLDALLGRRLKRAVVQGALVVEADFDGA